MTRISQRVGYGETVRLAHTSHASGTYLVRMTTAPIGSRCEESEETQEPWHMNCRSNQILRRNLNQEEALAT